MYNYDKMAKPYYWTDYCLELLIDLYQERPSLYNTKHPDYFNREKRNKALSDMAKLIGTTGNLKTLSFNPAKFLVKWSA